jgi:hypothetical protein
MGVIPTVVRMLLRVFFDYPWGLTVADLYPTSSIYPTIWCNHIHKSLGGLRQELGVSEAAITCDVSRTDYSEDIIVFCAYTHKIHKMRTLFVGQFSHLNALEDRQILRNILRQDLCLKPDIAKVINTFKLTHFSQNTVGVHVRYTDIKIPLDQVIERARQVVSHHRADSLFLATDAQEVVTQFQQEFEQQPPKKQVKVLTAPKWFPPPGQRMHQNWEACEDRVQNGREALIDLYLLAACSDLVYSSQSSFGVVASLLSSAKSRHLHNMNDGSRLDKVKRKLRQLINLK